jgi:hypothetical protein
MQHSYKWWIIHDFLDKKTKKVEMELQIRKV